MPINIYPTEEKLIGALADYIIASANQSIEKNNRFSFVVSGGNSPQKLYALLASPALKKKVAWERVDFFFGDERYVPKTDPDSNYRMVKQVLFDPLHIDASHIFSIDTTKDPQVAAKEYTDVITHYFSGYTCRFDFVLLGLGDNAHTASLFPATVVLEDRLPAVSSVYLSDKKLFRITMNAPLLNLASRITFLVYGEAKSTAVYNVLKGESDAEQFPAQLISPKNGELKWFMDKAAALKLI